MLTSPMTPANRRITAHETIEELLATKPGQRRFAEHTTPATTYVATGETVFDWEFVKRGEIEFC